MTIDTKSIDFGHQSLNDHANTPDIFDTAKFPTATYTGKLAGFTNGAPKTVEGNSHPRFGRHRDDRTD